MKKESNYIKQDEFIWTQQPTNNQLVYTIIKEEDAIIAGGQSLSAAKIDKNSGKLIWKHPGTAFRTTEIISDASIIKTGGQYNNYAWEQIDRNGNSLNSTIPKYANEVYGQKH
tara:strand:- start:979 stop:1317 length:339 start_codon:yes stop_codon:yes gene_type:complete